MLPADLRSHYGADDFGGLSDTLLSKAIDRALSTINRYLSVAPILVDPYTEAEEQYQAKVLDVWLTIARAYAYDDQTLPPDHPVVRELNEALSWLKLVSTGSITFEPSYPYPDPASLIIPAQAPRVTAPAPVFGDDFGMRHPVGWYPYSYWERRG